MLGLTGSDVGRPITRLRLKLVDATDLEQVMLNVMSDVRPAYKRLKNAEGRKFELRVTPYRTSDNRIDGVVLSLLIPDDPNNTPGLKLDIGSKTVREKAAAKSIKAKKKTAKRKK